MTSAAGAAADDDDDDDDVTPPCQLSLWTPDRLAETERLQCKTAQIFANFVYKT